MVHPRGHEQTNGVLYFVLSAQGVGHAVEIIDGVLRGYGRVVPTVVQDELCSLRKEVFQIRIGRRDHSVVQSVCERHITIEVKRAEVPIRILKYQVLEMGRDNRWLPTTGEKAPFVFTARLKTRKDLLACPRVLRPSINLLTRIHL